jgi:hypothetical protein
MPTRRGAFLSNTVLGHYRQSEGLAIYYVNPYTFLDQLTHAELFPSHDNSYKEAALLRAALHLLDGGRADRFCSTVDEAVSQLPDLTLLRQYGKLGFSYASEAHHIAARKDVDVDAGLKFFAAAADKAASLLDLWNPAIR